MSTFEPTLTTGSDSTLNYAAVVQDELRPRGVAELAGASLLTLLRTKSDLVRNRSFVIQAAVEEYQKLQTDDESLTPETYCSQFANLDSALRSSIFRQLEVEEYVNRNSWLKEKLDLGSWPTIGEQRGSFLFTEELGRGALARVYLCSQPELGDRQVVVKVAATSLGEANSLGRLSHRNIVPVHSVELDESNGMSMLCMPFVGRSTLFDYIDRLPGSDQDGVDTLHAAARAWAMPTDRMETSSAGLPSLRGAGVHHVVAWIGEQLADALAHAHRNGIFHGDVKPSNVLLTHGGTPLLMDFNLSGNIASSTAANGGTLPYMPPEQVRSIAIGTKKASRYDERSDIYSLGVVLYEALTGRLPFQVREAGASLESVAAQILEMQRRGPTPISSLNPRVPASLQDLIHQCIQFLPASRPQSAGELAIRLRHEHGSWSRFQWQCRTQRKKLYAISAILITVLGLTGIAVAQRPPRHERLLAEALELRSAGHGRQAERMLGLALEAAPSFATAQFELGRTALATDSLLKANEEFYKLERLQRDARSAAYMGYSYNLRGRHDAAIPWYVLAIERGGDVPEVLNNLAYSYQKGSSALLPRDERTVSQRYLSKALQLKPDFKSAQLNWVRLAVQRFQEDTVPLPDNLPGVCRSLISSYPNNGFIFSAVADALTILAAKDPAYRQEALRCLARSVELGYGPASRSLETSEFWQPLRGEQDFQEIVRLASEPGPKKAGLGISLAVEPISLSSVR